MTVYKLTVSFDIMVVADSPAKAAKVAEHYAIEEAKNGFLEISSPIEIKSVDEIPRAFSYTLPWGGQPTSNRDIESYIDHPEIE
jgi:hypothetical protein